MKISEGLTLLKNLKSKAAKVDKYIDECVVQYEDAPSDYVYAEEVQRRGQLENVIMHLKMAIATANATTNINFQGQDLVLSDLVLLNARLRTDLGFWNKLLAKTLTDSSSYRERTKDQIKKVFAPGYDKKQIRQIIENLENEKAKVEAAINNANATTDLAVSFDQAAATGGDATA